MSFKTSLIILVLATLLLLCIVAEPVLSSETEQTAAAAQMCIGKNPNDPEVCSGKGVCRNGKCYCPSGRAGENCECTYDPERTCRGPIDNE